MKYFHSHGGNNKPYFSYRIKVANFTEEMYNWCEEFDDEGRPFRRWHVEWESVYVKTRDYDIVQFEWEDAALLFKLTFAGV